MRAVILLGSFINVLSCSSSLVFPGQAGGITRWGCYLGLWALTLLYLCQQLILFPVS